MFRTYSYQQGWTDDFTDKADVEFVVEGIVLPVHSIFFFDSEILQGCFEDTADQGKPRLENCFSRYKVQDMIAFLCQIYPMVDPDKLELREHIFEIVDLAIQLGCGRVINTVGAYLERYPELFLSDFEDFKVVKYEKWFMLTGKLASSKIVSILTGFLVQAFDDMKKRFSHAELSSILTHLSSAALLQFTLGRENLLKQGPDGKIKRFRSCDLCAKTLSAQARCWVFDRTTENLAQVWKCSSCNTESTLQLQRIGL